MQSTISIRQSKGAKFIAMVDKKDEYDNPKSRVHSMLHVRHCLQLDPLIFCYENHRFHLKYVSKVDKMIHNYMFDTCSIVFAPKSAVKWSVLK